MPTIWPMIGVIIERSASASTTRMSSTVQPYRRASRGAARGDGWIAHRLEQADDVRLDPGAGRVIEGTRLDRSVPRAFARPLGEGVVGVDRPAQVDEAEDDEEEDREGEGELDHRLAAPPLLALANHQLSTVIVVVRHGRNSPAVMLCETTV